MVLFNLMLQMNYPVQIKPAEGTNTNGSKLCVYLKPASNLITFLHSVTSLIMEFNFLETFFIL